MIHVDKFDEFLHNFDPLIMFYQLNFQFESLGLF